MAHQVETMAYAGAVPWHGLGVNVESTLTPDQMLKAAGLDWEVEKYANFIKIGKTTKMTGEYSLVRSSDDKILSTVSKDWNPNQNREAFDFFNEFVQEGDMEMHTAGSLKGGQIVWALAKVNDSFELFGGDRVDSYLLFTNPHKFGHAIDVRFTPIRVVCNNTLTMAVSEAVERMVKVNHRKKFDPDGVKATLLEAKDTMDRYKEVAQLLGSKPIATQTVTEYFEKVFPALYERKTDRVEDGTLRKNVQLAFDALDNQPGTEFAPGTWWQAYNAVTYLTDHVLGKSADTRLSSAWYGTNQQRKLKALNLAVQYANKA